MKRSKFISFGYSALTGCSLALLVACGGGEVSENNDDAVEVDSTMEEEMPDDDQKVVIYVTPSMIEIAAVIKTTGATFSSDVLNDIENKKQYTTQFKQAVNMGVYGADLAYAAMFDETQTSLNYLKTVQQMTTDMGMDGVFESALIEQIQSNITNQDSLIGIISEFFWSADAYLEDNERGEVAALIVAGGWVEATYITVNMALNAPSNNAIRDRIGEQKLIANNLVLLLRGKLSKENEQAQDLLAKIEGIKSVLDEAEMEQNTGKVIANEEEQTTTIDNSSSVTLSEDVLNKLNEEVSAVRAELIK